MCLNETQWTKLQLRDEETIFGHAELLEMPLVLLIGEPRGPIQPFSCDFIAVSLWAIKGGVLSASRDGGKTWNTESPSDVSSVCAYNQFDCCLLPLQSKV
jgi:hypothetical protein